MALSNWVRLAAMLTVGAVTGVLAATPTRAQEGIGYRSQELGATRARNSNYTPGGKAASTTRHFNVQLNATEVYDSNVSRSSAAVAASRGIKQQDEIFKPSLKLDAFLPVGREAVFLDGGIGYDAYAYNHRLDRERINLDGGARAAFGPCKETLEDVYRRNQRSLADITSLRRTSDTLSMETIEANASCGRGIGLVPSVGVSEDWSSNSSSRFRSSDYHAFAADAALGYAQPALGTLSLFGSYRHTIFPNRTLFGFIPISEGYQLYAGGLSFDHHVGALIDLSASVSYTSLQPSLAGVRGFNGLTYSAKLGYHPTARLRASLELHRATLPSTRTVALYSLEDTLFGSVSYRLGPRLTLAVGGGANRRKFVSGSAVTQPGITQEVNYIGYGSATYNLAKRWSLILDMRRVQRDATPSLFSYGSTRVTLTAIARF